jgi:hypothetical protein
MSDSVRGGSYTRSMDWLAAYGLVTHEHPGDLGEPATLTVILRDLDTDDRSYSFLPVAPSEPGEAQREAILRTMAGRFPDARWKTYDAEKQVASFVGRRHLYIAIYEEHETAGEWTDDQRPRLFAV